MALSNKKNMEVLIVRILDKVLNLFGDKEARLRIKNDQVWNGQKFVGFIAGGVKNESKD